MTQSIILRTRPVRGILTHLRAPTINLDAKGLPPHCTPLNVWHKNFRETQRREGSKERGGRREENQRNQNTLQEHCQKGHQGEHLRNSNLSRHKELFTNLHLLKWKGMVIWECVTEGKLSRSQWGFLSIFYLKVVYSRLYIIVYLVYLDYKPMPQCNSRTNKKSCKQ